MEPSDRTLAETLDKFFNGLCGGQAETKRAKQARLRLERFIARYLRFSRKRGHESATTGR